MAPLELRELVGIAFVLPGFHGQAVGAWLWSRDPARLARRRGERVAHNRLRLGENGEQVMIAAETLGVDLVDILRSRGPCREPGVLGDDLETADGRIVSRRARQELFDFLAGKIGALYLLGGELREHRFLLGARARLDAIGRRLAPVPRQLAIQRARIAPGARGDLRGQECGGDAVLVRGPYRAVGAQECGSGAFLRAKSAATVEEPGDEPFEADRYLIKPARKARRPAVNHGAAHQGLTHRARGLPARTMAEEIIDRDTQIVVRRQEPGIRRHDAVAVMVGIAAESDVKAVLQADEALLGVPQ